MCVTSCRCTGFSETQHSPGPNGPGGPDPVRIIPSRCISEYTAVILLDRGTAASLFGGVGHVMIHVLRGRRTWLETSPALREDGEVSHCSFPGLFFALSRARLPQGGRRRRIKYRPGGNDSAARAYALFLVPIWRRQKPLASYLARTVGSPPAARGCPATGGGE
jgi:hypothetical protein